jgi:hypothetical protein
MTEEIQSADDEVNWLENHSALIRIILISFILGFLLGLLATVTLGGF